MKTADTKQAGKQARRKPPSGQSLQIVLRPPGPEPRTLCGFERATKVALRDTAALHTLIQTRLRELRELDVRGRALLRDASGMSPGDVLMAIGDALHAEQAQA